LGVKKLATSFYSMVQKYFDILDRLGVAHTVWQTDRQTDRMAFSNRAVWCRQTRAKLFTLLRK